MKTEALKNFILENINLINQNTKESWKQIYDKLKNTSWLTGELTKMVLDAGITDPASILGYIPDYYLSQSKIQRYVIPNSVTWTGRLAFSSCFSLKSVEIPNSVKWIGDYAFFCCLRLTNVKIGDSVTSIGEYAFEDCSKLTSVVIPDSVTSIGKYMFLRCSNLTNVVIPSSVTYVGERVFCHCDSLKEIRFGGTKEQAIKIGLKMNSWREDSAIEKIICTDGEIIL